MATWQAGQAIAGTGLTLRQRLSGEEPWGTIWRTTHQTHGLTITVFYRGDVGRALFEEAQPGLRRWQELAGRSIAGLLPILDINPNALCVTVADPGGPTLRERFAAGWQTLREPADALIALAKVLVFTKTYELPAVGITPDTVIETGKNPDAPWCLLPVAPGVRQHAGQMAAGRYTAPEVSGDAPLLDLNSDSYAMSWLALDIYRQDFSAPRDPATLRTELPFPRLRTILGNGLRPTKGVYDDPKFFQLALERWVKNEMAEDWKEEQERQAASVRKPWQQKLHDNQVLLKRVGIGAGSLLLVIFLVMCIPRLFTTSNTEKTPYGTVNLFFERLKAGDVAGAQKYTTGGATIQADALLREIRGMEAKNLTSRFGSAIPQVQGAGDVRTVKIDLKGVNGDLFMMAEMTIRQQPGGIWRVDELYYKPLREEAEK